MELRAAEIAEARGLWDDAELLLRNALAAEAGSNDLQAEISGRSARLCARRGHHERALEIIAEIIDLTADSGELDLLLRASCHAGEVADLVALPEDAKLADRRTMLCVAVIVVQAMMSRRDNAEAMRALDTAWQLAEDETGQFSDEVSAEDCLRLCLLHARLVGPTRHIVARALALLPSCLASAESWWDVDELLDHALACRDRDAALPAAVRAGLAFVRRLARNRPGWQPRLDLLEPGERTEPERAGVREC